MTLESHGCHGYSRGDAGVDAGELTRMFVLKILGSDVPRSTVTAVLCTDSLVARPRQQKPEEGVSVSVPRQGSFRWQPPILEPRG